MEPILCARRTPDNCYQLARFDRASSERHSKAGQLVAFRVCQVVGSHTHHSNDSVMTFSLRFQLTLVSDRLDLLPDEIADLESSRDDSFVVGVTYLLLVSYQACNYFVSGLTNQIKLQESLTIVVLILQASFVIFSPYFNKNQYFTPIHQVEWGHVGAFDR